MADEPLGNVPDRTGTEIGSRIVAAGLSAIPVFGGPAAELFDAVIGPSLEKRRNEWLHRLGEAVEEIRARIDGFDVHDLKNNEQFVTTVLAVSVLAVKTHQEEKLEALRNAVVNSALPSAPDEFEQMTFLRYVDELTPLHVRLLTFLADPGDWYDRRGLARPNIMAGGLSAIVGPAFPELGGFAEQVTTDLTSRGLTVSFSFAGVMTGPSLWVSRVPEFGQRFLAFISPSPAEVV